MSTSKAAVRPDGPASNSDQSDRPDRGPDSEHYTKQNNTHVNHVNYISRMTARGEEGGQQRVGTCPEDGVCRYEDTSGSTMQLRSVSGMNIPQGRVTVTGRRRAACRVPSPGAKGSSATSVLHQNVTRSLFGTETVLTDADAGVLLIDFALRTADPARPFPVLPMSTTTVTTTLATGHCFRCRRRSATICPSPTDPKQERSGALKMSAINKGARESARTAASIYISLRRQRPDAGSARAPSVVRGVRVLRCHVFVSFWSAGRCSRGLRRRECEFPAPPDDFPNDR